MHGQSTQRNLLERRALRSAGKAVRWVNYVDDRMITEVPLYCCRLEFSEICNGSLVLELGTV